MRIFAGVPPSLWRGGININSGVIENVDFQAFGRRTLRLRHLRKWWNEANINSYRPIVLFSPNVAFPLHDLEWPFYVQFSLGLLRTAFLRLGYNLSYRAIYRIFLLYDVTSRDVRKRIVKTWSAEYCSSEKGFRIFRRRNVAQPAEYVVGTLTNKAKGGNRIRCILALKYDIWLHQFY